MTTLYVSKHPIGLKLSTRLPEAELGSVEDFSMLLIEGEFFGGLSYEELESIAITSGSVDSERLTEH